MKVFYTCLHYLFLLGIITLASCGFKKTETGAEYKVLDDQDGPALEAGGLAILNMKYYNEIDSFQNKSIRVDLHEDFRKKHSIESVLLSLTKGDSVVIRLLSDSVYLGEEIPAKVKGGFTTFEIRIKDVLSKDSADKMREALAMEQQATLVRRQMKLQADTLQIRDYLNSKKIKFKRTVRGVYYVITKKAEGINLQPGDTAEAIYTGRFWEDGKVFDSNVGKAPYQVVVGVGQVIEGFDFALMAMKKGEKGTFYIPSELAYGEEGTERIPPNSILSFDLEVLE